MKIREVDARSRCGIMTQDDDTRRRDKKTMQDHDARSRCEMMIRDHDARSRRALITENSPPRATGMLGCIKYNTIKTDTARMTCWWVTPGEYTFFFFHTCTSQ